MECFDISVSSVMGKDNDNNNKIFKTLDAAINILKNGNKIIVYPGKYDGINIESDENLFSYHLEGIGSDVQIREIIYNGYIINNISNVKLQMIELKCSDSHFDFKNVNFIGNNKIECSEYLTSLCNSNNYIEFDNCKFGINFQIMIKNGSYNLTFKNCKFSNSSIPFIYTKNGNIDIKLTLCNFNTSMLFNKNAFVNIHHTSCIFTDSIWTGKECIVHTKDGEININENQSSIPKINNIEIDDFLHCAIKINTDLDNIIQLKADTEFVYACGKNSLKVALPHTSLIKNGHYIEILNEALSVIINDVEYKKKNIKIRFIIGNGWIFY